MRSSASAASEVAADEEEAPNIGAAEPGAEAAAPKLDAPDNGVEFGAETATLELGEDIDEPNIGEVPKENEEVGVAEDATVDNPKLGFEETVEEDDELNEKPKGAEELGFEEAEEPNENPEPVADDPIANGDADEG